MSKNVVFLTSIPYSQEQHLSYEQYCLNTWKYWCNKNNVELFILNEPVVDPFHMKPNWQKMYAFDLLNANNIDYDQVLIVDIDTMIKWDTPNFFNLTNNNFTAIIDNDNINWVTKSIKGYQHFFPDINIHWTEYFNSGFVIFHKKHKKVINGMLDMWDKNSEELIYLQNNLKKGHDQTPLNYMVKQMGFDVNYLPKTFNLTHLQRKEILQDLMFIDCGYIWHFNGFDKNYREPLMKQTWDKIKHNYE